MIVGFLMVYNEVDWVGRAIDQAMAMCDRLVVSEGSQFVSFPDLSERSDDGTLDVLLDKDREYPGFLEVVPTTRVHCDYRRNQCDNFNVALCGCEIGDCFVPLDADTFYSDVAVEEIVGLMRDGCEGVMTDGRLFAFSMRWEMMIGGDRVRGRDAFYRVVEGMRFKPTHRPIGNGEMRQLSGLKLFHYTWVKRRDRMRTRMRTSGMFPGMLKWFDEGWDLVDLVDGGMFETYMGEAVLKRYDESHPSVLDGHPWLVVDDLRSLT